MRFLCEGRWTPPGGKQLAYQEVPWGATYLAAFNGRCIQRAARTFGNKLAAFDAAMQNWPGLKAEHLYHGQSASETGKTGWRFEFISGFYMSMLLWTGDDEFPPSAQILFDDNFPASFTAEDLAVVGECAIGRIKERIQ
jgi:hypothetical protein